MTSRRELSEYSSETAEHLTGPMNSSSESPRELKSGIVWSVLKNRTGSCFATEATEYQGRDELLVRVEDMIFGKKVEITERSQALDILGPSFRSLHLVGVGPFQRHHNGKYKEPIRMKRSHKLRSMIAPSMLVRFVVVCVLRFFFARHLVGAAASDIVRDVACMAALKAINTNLEKLHWVIRLIDEAPTTAEKNASVHRSCIIGISMTWIYIGYRVVLDIVTFFMENRFVPYIETDLFLPRNKISTVFYPLIYVTAFCDILINRIFITAPMCLGIYFYSYVNTLLRSKFRHLDDDIRRFTNEYTPPMAEIQATEIRMRHARFCEVIQAFDDVFCAQVFAWHGCCVGIACTEAVASIQMMKKNFQLLRFLGTMANIGIMLSFLLAFGGTGALVSECKNRSRIQVNAFQTRTLSGSAISHQIRLLLSQMDQKIQMTAWKIYKLDRGAIMTTLGACITYVSLVIEETGDVLED